MALYNENNTKGAENKVSSSSTSANLTPEQQSFLKSITGAYTGSVAPGIANVLAGSQGQFNQDLNNVNNAASLYGQSAANAGNNLGFGAQAANSAVSSLGSVGSGDYLQNQINAALAPAQLQYQRNLADQTQDFSGSGQLGSTRQAIAQNALASTNAANQGQLAANIANNVANQQINAQQSAGQLGLNAANQSLNAYNQSAQASSLPLDYYNKYANIIYGAANQTQPNFSGTQGQNQQSINQQASTTQNVKFGTGEGSNAGIGGDLAGLAEGLKQYGGAGVNIGGDLYNWLKEFFKNNQNNPATPNPYDGLSTP